MSSVMTEDCSHSILFLALICYLCKCVCR